LEKLSKATFTDLAFFGARIFGLGFNPSFADGGESLDHTLDEFSKAWLAPGFADGDENLEGYVAWGTLLSFLPVSVFGDADAVVLHVKRHEPSAKAAWLPLTHLGVAVSQPQFLIRKLKHGTHGTAQIVEGLRGFLGETTTNVLLEDELEARKR